MLEGVVAAYRNTHLCSTVGCTECIEMLDEDENAIFVLTLNSPNGIQRRLGYPLPGNV